MKIFAIDPGTEKSGVVLYEPGSGGGRVHGSSGIDNDTLLIILRSGFKTCCESWMKQPDVVVIEDIVGMSQTVGREVFETCKWIGRFREAWEHGSGLSDSMKFVIRTDEKTVLCGGQTYKDPESGRRKGFSNSQIRKALIERFAPTGGGKVPQVGMIKQKGPLYGVTAHSWSALAVAMTYYLMLVDDTRKALRG